MVGGGPFDLKPGQWTDDTSMALCMAESLIETGGFDARDQMERYLRWWRNGHLSSTGRCFDIGRTTAAALRRYTQTREPYSGSTSRNSSGNGSLMRLAPVVMFFETDPAKAIHFAAESSKTTHGSPIAIDACRYFAGLLIGAMHGATKEQILAPYFSPVDTFRPETLDSEIAAITSGAYRGKAPLRISSSGYVAHTLEAALWCFAQTDSFREGCLLAANLGDDADTTAAVYGQIAGAFYGEDAIPAQWREKLALKDIVYAYANQLYQLSSSPR